MKKKCSCLEVFNHNKLPIQKIMLSNNTQYFNSYFWFILTIFVVSGGIALTAVYITTEDSLRFILRHKF